MVTKKQMTIRINKNLLDRMEKYIQRQNKRGKTIKKIEVIEIALLMYLDEIDRNI